MLAALAKFGRVDADHQEEDEDEDVGQDDRDLPSRRQLVLRREQAGGIRTWAELKTQALTPLVTPCAPTTSSTTAKTKHREERAS